MKKLTALVAAALLLLGGCAAKPKEAPPHSVAQRFWDAIVHDDLQAAKACTIRGKIEERVWIKVKLKRVVTRDARIVNGRAFVPTTLVFTLPVESVASKECNTTMETELLKIEGRWLVDEIVTMENYEDALHKGVAACTSMMLEEAIDKGLEHYEALQKELQKNLMEFEKTFERTIRELQQRLQKSLEQMQKRMTPPSQLPEPQESEKI
jgi:DNA-binding Lrp family transcriptional regulator